MQVFDSNCITPGTEFMTEVSSHLKYLVRRRIAEDDAWKHLKVIVSGHEAPGEGEHKIVAFIRGYKRSPHYDPNTRHCMAGLDADLIMLGLATHEPHFTLLREQVDFNAFRVNKFGTKTATRTTGGKKYQLLHIGLLREYLEVDLRPPASAWAAASASAAGAGAAAAGSPRHGFLFDGERAIDDFILLSCLCGNDFLPHLPSLDIGEGALDSLLTLYRSSLPSWGGYLVEDGGCINWHRLGQLLAALGKMEEEVFKARAADAARFAARQRRAAKRAGDPVVGLTAGLAGAGGHGHGKGAGAGAGAGADSGEPESREAALLTAGELPADDDDEEGKDGDRGDGWLTKALAAFRESADAEEVDDSRISPAARAAAEETILAAEAAAAAARLAAATGQATGGAHEDTVVDAAGHELRRPPSPYVIETALSLAAKAASSAAVPESLSFALKSRYYKDKFGIGFGPVASKEDGELLRALVQSYAEALQWVMLYYFRGVPSWGWFFPFHYAPMASDMTGLPDLTIAFALGAPFKPFQQLLGCLPAASSGFLPASYAALMKEPWSPLLSFYPDVAHIKIDQNGKRNPWEAVTLIPFIQERAMLEALSAHAPDSALTAAERARNSFGVDLLIEADPAASETLVSSMPGQGGWEDKPLCGTRVRVFDDMPTAAVLAPPEEAPPPGAPRNTLAESAAAALASSGKLIPVTAAALARDAHHYRSRPHADTVLPCPGYPTLHTLLFSPMLAAVRLNVFGMPSRKDSLILAVGEAGRRPPEEEEAEEDEGFLGAAGAAAALFGGSHDHGEHGRGHGHGHGDGHKPGASPSSAAAAAAGAAYMSLLEAATGIDGEAAAAAAFAEGGGASPSDPLASPALDPLAKPHTQPVPLDLEGSEDEADDDGEAGEEEGSSASSGRRPGRRPRFAAKGGRGHKSKSQRSLLPPHLPLFSCRYAEGTTVAAVRAATNAAAYAAGSPSSPAAAAASPASARKLARSISSQEHALPLGDALSYLRRQHQQTAVASPAASADASAAASEAKPFKLNARTVANALLGRVVYVDWPHLREAVVTGVSDSQGRFDWHGEPDDSLLFKAGSAGGAGAAAAGSEEDPLMRYPVSWDDDVSGRLHDPEEAMEWTREAEAHKDLLLAGRRTLTVCGVRVGLPGVLIHARKLAGMQRDPDTGALTRVWGSPEAPSAAAALAAIKAAAGPYGRGGGGGGPSSGDIPASAAVTTLPELVLVRNPAPDPRMRPHGPVSLAQRFPVGKPVVVLRGPARGCLANVVGYSSAEAAAAGAAGAASAASLDAAASGAAGAATSGALVVSLRDPTSLDPEPPFGHSIASAIKDRYYSASQAAELIGIPPGVLGRVASSIFVDMGPNGGGSGGGSGRFDLGLNLRVSKSLFLPGYVRPTGSVGGAAPSAGSTWGGNRAGVSVVTGSAGGGGGAAAAYASGWEYAERTIHLVVAYQRAFPALFEVLEAKQEAPFLHLRDVPGRAEGVIRIGTWLQQLDTHKKPLVPLTSAFMAPSAIGAVQTAADRFADLRARKRAEAKDASAAAAPTYTLPARSVFAREANAYAVGGVGAGSGSLSAGGAAAAAAAAGGNVDGPSCVPQLGDRVASLSFPHAPLGVRGTVVAVHGGSGFVEVLFDTAFVGGSSLGGLCAAGRGALVPWSALLCLSRAPSADGASSSAAAGADGVTAGVVAAAADAEARAGGLADDFGPRGKVRRTPSSAAGAGAGRADGKAPGASPVSRSGSGAAAGSAPAAASDREAGLKALATQVDFYMSDANLRKDAFLQARMAAISDAGNLPAGAAAGAADASSITLVAAPLSLLLTFNRMRELAQGVRPERGSDVATALAAALPRLSGSGLTVAPAPRSVGGVRAGEQLVVRRAALVLPRPSAAAPAAAGASGKADGKGKGGKDKGKAKDGGSTPGVAAAPASAAAPAVDPASTPIGALLLAAASKSAAAGASAAVAPAAAPVPMPMPMPVPMPMPLGVPMPLPSALMPVPPQLLAAAFGAPVRQGATAPGAAAPAPTGVADPAAYWASMRAGAVAAATAPAPVSAPAAPGVAPPVVAAASAPAAVAVADAKSAQAAPVAPAAQPAAVASTVGAGAGAGAAAAGGGSAISALLQHLKQAGSGPSAPAAAGAGAGAGSPTPSLLSILGSGAASTSVSGASASGSLVAAPATVPTAASVAAAGRSAAPAAPASAGAARSGGLLVPAQVTGRSSGAASAPGGSSSSS